MREKTDHKHFEYGHFLHRASEEKPSISTTNYIQKRNLISALLLVCEYK